MYKRTTKPNKENSKPKFIFKIPVVKNSAQCPIYDQKKICQPIDKITKDWLAYNNNFEIGKGKKPKNVTRKKEQ